MAHGAASHHPWNIDSIAPDRDRHNLNLLVVTKGFAYDRA